jgi:hypothetical protein
MWLVNAPVPDPAMDLANGSAADRTIVMRADQSGWVPIGRGPVLIRADGTIKIGEHNAVPDDDARPGDGNALVPTLPYGMLVGKIGESGPAFKVGRVCQIASKDNVYLAINDSDHSDNSGAYTVRMSSDIFR